MEDNFVTKIERFKLPILLSALGIVLIIGGIFTSGINHSKPKDFPKESIVEAQKLISVDVSGAVEKPGVYQFKDGARIEEAISSAGGFSNSANKEYISKYLNMAQKLSDGSKIYVPFEGEAAPGVQSGGKAVAGVSSKVNINTSAQADIEALPGIGPATAAKIISGRPYQTPEDLINKKAVSKSIFDKIKDLIVVY